MEATGFIHTHDPGMWHIYTVAAKGLARCGHGLKPNNRNGVQYGMVMFLKNKRKQDVVEFPEQGLDEMYGRNGRLQSDTILLFGPLVMKEVYVPKIF